MVFSLAGTQTLFMKNRTALLITAAVWSYIAIAAADTLILKDGSRMEGKIISENDEFYFLEIQVTETIKDERKVEKKEVAEVDRIPADIAEFAELKDLVPAPDLLDEEDYKKRIKKLKEFLRKFPASSKNQSVLEMQDTLIDEFGTIKRGGLKLKGEMITREQYEANAYEYDALVSESQIMDAISGRNFIGAVRSFAEYDQKFEHAAGRDQLAAQMIKVLTVFGSSLEQSSSGYEARVKSREKGLAQMSPEDRVSTSRAISEKFALIDAQFQQEKADKIALVTPHFLHQDSLREAIRQVSSEMRRIEASGKKRKADKSPEETYRKVWEQLPSATDEEKKEIFGSLKNQALPEEYMQLLEKRAE